MAANKDELVSIVMKRLISVVLNGVAADTVEKAVWVNGDSDDPAWHSPLLVFSLFPSIVAFQFPRLDQHNLTKFI